MCRSREARHAFVGLRGDRLAGGFRRAVAAPGAAPVNAAAAVPCAATTAAHPLLRAWVDPRASLPDLAELERLCRAAEARDGVERPVFAAQTPALLGDGLHYESRIAAHRRLATRAGDAHDAFNALVWLRHPLLKWALNARQVADIACVGPRTRTRGQCALTHFDEAGAIVWLADDGLAGRWDAHDWHALFADRRGDWGRRVAVTVFGHALLEHVWHGHVLPVAKCIGVRVDAADVAARSDPDGVLDAWPDVERRIAEAIRRGELLADPQELRPLPLAGMPGWHDGDTAAFVAAAPCFRPLRAGRRYPPPWRSAA